MHYGSSEEKDSEEETRREEAGEEEIDSPSQDGEEALVVRSALNFQRRGGMSPRASHVRSARGRLISPSKTDFLRSGV
jgi:hypothetical protein